MNINNFITRLRNIGISLEFAANYPWIYLTKINGVKVTEKFHANHGFTAFYSSWDGTRISDRREVFKLIRKYINESA